jgi:glucosamine--fructose-6-phosphate aminotransferase (isomerizing)
MSKFLDDILAQPGRLRTTLAHTLGAGRPALDAAAELTGSGAPILISGIGSSWHGGFAVQAHLLEAGLPAALVEASDLLFYPRVLEGATLLLLSRSGRSVEVVRLIELARQSGARTIGITNDPESALANGSDVPLLLEIPFDHNVSVAMYTAPALVGCLVAAAVTGRLDDALAASLDSALGAAEAAIPGWQKQAEGSDWFAPRGHTYLLGRGPGLASCQETRLLWEEAAKSSASVLTAPGFRHGPQEMLHEGLRAALWIDPSREPHHDLALARDLRKLGAKVMLIGQGLPADAGDLVFNVPPIAAEWQFLVDIIPAQLAAERLARVRGVDCDEFRLCSFIVADEGGLL